MDTIWGYYNPCHKIAAYRLRGGRAEYRVWCQGKLEIAVQEF